MLDFNFKKAENNKFKANTRVSLIAHIGSISTDEAISLAIHAEALGYNRRSDVELYGSKS